MHLRISCRSVPLFQTSRVWIWNIKTMQQSTQVWDRDILCQRFVLVLKPLEPDRQQTRALQSQKVPAPGWYVSIASNRAGQLHGLPAQLAPKLREIIKTRCQYDSADLLVTLTQNFPPNPRSSSRSAESRQTEWPKQRPQHLSVTLPCLRTRKCKLLSYGNAETL